MSYKVERDLEEYQVDYIENMGGRNSLPEPYELSDFQQFWIKFSSNIPNRIESRYAYNSDEHIGSVQIYYFDNVAYAVTFDKKTYRIGCKHQYKVISKIGCYTHSKCEKCGNDVEIDSGD
jgi:hypothetical protein